MNQRRAPRMTDLLVSRNIIQNMTQLITLRRACFPAHGFYTEILSLSVRWREACPFIKERLGTTASTALPATTRSRVTPAMTLSMEEEVTISYLAVQATTPSTAATATTPSMAAEGTTN